MAAGTGLEDNKFDVFTPEIWSPRLNRFLRVRLAAAPFFIDLSDEVAQGGDVIHVPHIDDNFSATSVPVTSGTIAGTDVTSTKTNLTVDQWQAVAYLMTDFEAREVAKKYRLQNEYAKAMGYALAKKLDTDLLALTGSMDRTAATTTTDLVATNIEHAFGILSSDAVPREECVFFVHPKVYWNDLMAEQKYYDASQFGMPSLPKGAHDRLYGVPVVLTTQVTGGNGAGTLGLTNALVHRSSVIYAIGRGGAKFSEKPSENLRRKVIADIIYGKVLMNDKRGVRILATSL